MAKKTNNFADIDKEYAYAIWLVEKEFNVGPITDDYLILKFWNLFDKDNIQRYNNDQQNNKPNGMPNTFK